MAQVVIEHFDKFFLGPKKEQIHALRNVNLAIEDKELMVLVGPSGCGKSTLLRTIAGLEEPSQGTISIDGKEMTRVPPKDRDVAMVFQNCALYPHLTVYENIAFGLILRGCGKAEIERSVLEAAELLGLKPCLARMPNQLSGGERQRVALGRAMVRKPKVFLLDEPLSNLDTAMRTQMRLELARLHARLGATMLYVTHDQVEAMTLGQRIAVMFAGAVQQVAEPMTLYRRPANLFVAGFLGSPPMNFISGHVTFTPHGVRFDGTTGREGQGKAGSVFAMRNCAGSKFEGLADRELVLGIRPEDLTVESPLDAEMANPQIASAFAKATIEVIEPRGAETYLHLAVGRQGLVARVHPDFPVRVQQTVRISFDLGKAHVFDPATGLAVRSPDGSVDG